MLLEAIDGGLDLDDGVYAYCDGVKVACRNEGERWVACSHQVHEAHPRYRDSFERLRAIVSADTNVDCPWCGGSGWLPVNNVNARRQADMAKIFKVFKGVYVDG